MTKKILVVDDEPDMLAVISIRFKRWGYSVVHAASGAEAFKKIKKEKPGLILLDLALPDMEGDNICLKVKSSPKTSSVPVVVISAVMENLPERTKNCGADDCLLKPYEASALLKKIERFFPLKKAEPLTGDELKDIKKIAPDY
ncbi:MAG: response regulator, partial [Elusimicrobia bacterium]|nr:response regulator [Elusimicrobiota bacterium]